MKRRIVSLLTALLIATTVFAVPAVPASAVSDESEIIVESSDVIDNNDNGQITETPAQPENPADPTDPAEPETPVDPSEPENPEQPVEPDEPEQPVEPDQPEVTEPVSIETAVVTIAQSAYEFTKKAVKPAVTVTVDGETLDKNEDYKVTYSNNVYPGTATITVTGINDYEGTVTKTFGIATVEGVKWKKSTTSTIKLDWKDRKNITEYNIYRYNTSKKKWVFVKSVKQSEATISHLTAGRGYSFRVRAVYKADGKTYLSPEGTTQKVPTKPNKVTIKKIINHPALYAQISWNKKNSSGYQIKYSRYSSFKNAKTVKVTSSKTLNKKISNLKNNQKYYVKVRAYKTYGNRTTYGEWSKSKSFATNGTRWYKENGKQYYYVKGKLFKGKKMFGRHQYYFNSDDGAWSGASATMWKKVKNSYSKTDYLIAVSRELNRVCVYEGEKGDWTLKYYWMCSTGRPENGKISKTPTGSWLMPKEDNHLGYIGGHKDYTCWYATRFYGRCFFHSVIYEPASKSQIQDGRLGMNISDGCIRMNIDNAKWIWDNCHTGTRVIVY